MTFKLDVFNKEAQANRGAWLHLINPETGEPAYLDEEETKPVRIKLLGMNSSVFEREKVELIRKARKNKNKKDKDITIEDLQKNKEEAAELYTKMTVEIENIPSFDGNGDLEPTFENLKKLYLEYMDIRTQAGDFIGKDANFINS